ncbi:hypothetical protein JOB18_005630 [Solea senegalensis]|uniref:Uncharacterized protein n=1 Tax=Solea senegalensis TaxID=28829 RepID=A0AAV6S139_SOLSE|nr:hypothetical protein JOB18_005630 [Solea senegalensis]
MTSPQLAEMKDDDDSGEDDDDDVEGEELFPVAELSTDINPARPTAPDLCPVEAGEEVSVGTGWVRSGDSGPSPGILTSSTVSAHHTRAGSFPEALFGLASGNGLNLATTGLAWLQANQLPETP